MFIIEDEPTDSLGEPKAEWLAFTDAAVVVPLLDDGDDLLFGDIADIDMDAAVFSSLKRCTLGVILFLAK